jgi:peptide deformylase
VETIDESVKTLIQDMVATMYAAPGIGLAAPQIGVPLRAIVIDLSVGKEKNGLITLLNPEFVSKEGEQKSESTRNFVDAPRPSRAFPAATPCCSFCSACFAAVP